MLGTSSSLPRGLPRAQPTNPHPPTCVCQGACAGLLLGHIHQVAAGVEAAGVALAALQGVLGSQQAGVWLGHRPLLVVCRTAGGVAVLRAEQREGGTRQPGGVGRGRARQRTVGSASSSLSWQTCPSALPARQPPKSIHSALAHPPVSRHQLLHINHKHLGGRGGPPLEAALRPRRALQAGLAMHQEQVTGALGVHPAAGQCPVSAMSAHTSALCQQRTCTRLSGRTPPAPMRAP